MGARRYPLEQEGLLQFFKQVFGVVGPFYGESDFYLAHPDRSPRCWRAERGGSCGRSLLGKESLSAGSCRATKGPADIDFWWNVLRGRTACTRDPGHALHQSLGGVTLSSGL